MQHKMFCGLRVPGLLLACRGYDGNGETKILQLQAGAL